MCSFLSITVITCYIGYTVLCLIIYDHIIFFVYLYHCHCGSKGSVDPHFSSGIKAFCLTPTSSMLQSESDSNLLKLHGFLHATNTSELVGGWSLAHTQLDVHTLIKGREK